MLLLLTPALTYATALGWRTQDAPRWHPLLLLLFDYSGKQSQIYNILFVLVFAFATLNILGLVARRYEPERNRNRLSFGETIAITVVLVSIMMLSWELLTLFKVFPIKLHPR
jgi:amino acid transporter